MNAGELAAIAARAQRAQHARTEAEYARRYGVGVAESHLRAADASALDIPRLLAAVRERDNTIARVRELHSRNYGFPTVNAMRIPDSKPVVFCQSCQVEYPCATIAALDPQETP